MGKPAARLTDTTAHGGLITGPGMPTVLIGKMPAATLGDMHVCPMLSPAVPPIPHVGGPIILGSMGVLIGKKPAARMGDMCVCVGPPATILLGEFTVLIGETSGGGGGGAKAASDAAGAAFKGAQGLSAFPVDENPISPTETHFIRCRMVDKAKQPIGGIRYILKDSKNENINGTSSPDGEVYYPGYAEKGNYKLTVCALQNAKWNTNKASMGDAIDFSVDADGFSEGSQASICILEVVEGSHVLVDMLTVLLEGKKFNGTWKSRHAEPISDGGSSEAASPNETGSDSTSDSDGAEDEQAESPNPPSENLTLPEFQFLCISEGQQILSDILHLSDFLDVGLKDSEGNNKNSESFKVHFSSGEIRSGSLDGTGKLRFEDVPPGTAKIEFPNFSSETVPPESAESGESGEPEESVSEQETEPET